MNWFTGVVLYVLIWWTVLFAVLPFGTRPVEDADAQTGWRGAPEQPRLLMKVIVTTLVAAVVWFGAWLLITSDLCQLPARLVCRQTRKRNTKRTTWSRGRQFRAIAGTITDLAG